MNTVSSYLDCLKESFLNVAAKAGRLDEVSSLLALGTEVDYRQSNQDDTALLASIRSDQKDAATLLLAYGQIAIHSDGTQDGYVALFALVQPFAHNPFSGEHLACGQLIYHRGAGYNTAKRCLLNAFCKRLRIHCRGQPRE